MKALIRRQLSFGVHLQWDGDDRIRVMDGDVEIESIPISSAGVRAALEAMKRIDDRMHADCQAMVIG